MLEKYLKRLRRKIKIRAKIIGSAQKPRLSVFRSEKHIYAQIIDDNKQSTLVSASDLEIKDKAKKSDLAKQVGNLIAIKANKKDIKSVIFDRDGYKYHGRVKMLADGAREKGLKF